MDINPDALAFTGYVETTVGALYLIHAARQGVIPRTTWRLNHSERQNMIKSGAVFVFSVQESGIKHWTDRLLWSPPRIVGNFLVYREINEKTSSREGHRRPYPEMDPRTRILARKSSRHQMSTGLKEHRAGGQGAFEVGGLIKATICVAIDTSDLHLVSYYTSEDIQSGKLQGPSSRSDIMDICMPPHIFRLTNFRVLPRIKMGPDNQPRLIEAEDMEPVGWKVEEHGYRISGSPKRSRSGPNFPVENHSNGNSVYPPTSGGRSGEIQSQTGRYWHPGSTSENTQDIRRPRSHPLNLFSPSPILAFGAQRYQSTHPFKARHTPWIRDNPSHPLLDPGHTPHPQNSVNQPWPSVINPQHHGSRVQLPTPLTTSAFGVPDMNALVDRVLSRAPAGNIVLFIGNGNVTGNTYRNVNNKRTHSE